MLHAAALDRSRHVVVQVTLVFPTTYVPSPNTWLRTLQRALPPMCELAVPMRAGRVKIAQSTA